MIGQSVAKDFGKNGSQVIPVFRKVPDGYEVTDVDESTSTKVITPQVKAKIGKCHVK